METADLIFTGGSGYCSFVLAISQNDPLVQLL